jgi:hypothetical protein
VFDSVLAVEARYEPESTLPPRESVRRDVCLGWENVWLRCVKLDELLL